MKNLLSTVLEAGKSKLKVLAFPFLGEGSLPGLQMVTFLLWTQLGQTVKHEMFKTKFLILLTPTCLSPSISSVNSNYSSNYTGQKLWNHFASLFSHTKKIKKGKSIRYQTQSERLSTHISKSHWFFQNTSEIYQLYTTGPSTFLPEQQQKPPKLTLCFQSCKCTVQSLRSYQNEPF